MPDMSCRQRRHLAVVADPDGIASAPPHPGIAAPATGPAFGAPGEEPGAPPSAGDGRGMRQAGAGIPLRRKASRILRDVEVAAIGAATATPAEARRGAFAPAVGPASPPAGMAPTGAWLPKPGLRPHRRGAGDDDHRHVAPLHQPPAPMIPVAALRSARTIPPGRDLT